jgi:hypothetical protein
VRLIRRTRSERLVIVRASQFCDDGKRPGRRKCGPSILAG